MIFRGVAFTRDPRLFGKRWVSIHVATTALALFALACGGDTLLGGAGDAGPDAEPSGHEWHGCDEIACPYIDCPIGATSQIVYNVCVDIDECATSDHGGCGDPLLVHCTNQNLGPAICTDVDECAVANGGCYGVNGICVNRYAQLPACVSSLDAGPTDAGPIDAGVTDAGTCPAGFAPSPPYGCLDIDECATDNGGCGAPDQFGCVNQIGALPTCTTLGPCAIDNGGCGPATFYTCDDTSGTATVCGDIDECATNHGGCGDPAFVTCVNNVGGVASCADVDECATANGGCGDPARFGCGNRYATTPTCVDRYSCANADCGSPTYIRCVEHTGAVPTCEVIENCGRFFGGPTTVFDTRTGQEWERDIDPATHSATWSGAQSLCPPGFKIPSARDFSYLPFDSCAFLDGGITTWTSSTDPYHPSEAAIVAGPGYQPTPLPTAVMMSSVMPVRCRNGPDISMYGLPYVTYWPR